MGKRPRSGVLTVSVPLDLLDWMDTDAKRRHIDGRTAYVVALLTALRKLDGPRPQAASRADRSRREAGARCGCG